MTLLELRMYLELNLAAYLGTYAVNGQLVPAVSVGPDNANNFRTTGVEAVLNESPELHRIWEYGHDRVLPVEERWTLTLKAWGDERELPAAVAAVMLAFPNVRDPLLSPATDDTIAQATFYLPIMRDINFKAGDFPVWFRTGDRNG